MSTKQGNTGAERLTRYPSTQATVRRPGAPRIGTTGLCGSVRSDTDQAALDVGRVVGTGTSLV